MMRCDGCHWLFQVACRATPKGAVQHRRVRLEVRLCSTAVATGAFERDRVFIDVHQTNRHENVTSCAVLATTLRHPELAGVVAEAVARGLLLLGVQAVLFHLQELSWYLEGVFLVLRGSSWRTTRPMSMIALFWYVTYVTGHLSCFHFHRQYHEHFCPELETPILEWPTCIIEHFWDFCRRRWNSRLLSRLLCPCSCT